jgi:hypothetical protein
MEPKHATRLRISAKVGFPYLDAALGTINVTTKIHALEQRHATPQPESAERERHLDVMTATRVPPIFVISQADAGMTP